MTDEQKKQIEEESGNIVQCRKITLQALLTFKVWKNDARILKSKEFFIRKLNMVHGQHLPKKMKECLDRGVKVLNGPKINTLTKELNNILPKLGKLIKNLQKESNDVEKCKVLAKELIELLKLWNKSKLQMEKIKFDILSKCITALKTSVINTPTIASYYHQLWSGIIQTRTANNKLVGQHVASLNNIINSSSRVNKNEM